MNRPWVHTRPLPPASLLPPLPCPRVSQGPGLSSLGQAVVKWNGGLLNRRLVAEKGRTWASEVKPSSVMPPSKACSPAPPCLSARDDSAPFSFVRCRSGPWCSSQGLLSASLQNSSELLISWNSRLRSWDVWMSLMTPTRCWWPTPPSLTWPKTSWIRWLQLPLWKVCCSAAHASLLCSLFAFNLKSVLQVEFIYPGCESLVFNWGRILISHGVEGLAWSSK